MLGQAGGQAARPPPPLRHGGAPPPARPGRVEASRGWDRRSPEDVYRERASGPLSHGGGSQASPSRHHSQH